MSEEGGKGERKDEPSMRARVEGGGGEDRVSGPDVTRGSHSNKTWKMKLRR